MALKVHFYIRPQKTKKNGEAPIYLRLTGNKRKEYSIGYGINPKKWDASAYKSKGKRPEDYQLNAHIQSIIGAIRRIETQLINEGEVITVQKILNVYLGKGLEDDSLLENYQEIVERLEKTIGLPDGLSKATVGRYKTVLKHFQAFLQYRYGVNDIGIQQLKYEHLKEFDFFLQTEKRIQNNARMKHIANFRRVIRELIEKGKLSNDPFKSWRGRMVHQERTRLSAEELQLLQEKELHTQRLGQVRDVFVFCCYTGLAYIDAYNLTEENLIITEGRTYISTFRQKTQSKCRVPLLKPAKEILEKYEDSLPRKIEGRLLPVKSNQKMNSYLKEIAALCGIEKKLTFHVARHTFATTITLANDVPIETVSEMLGHKS